MSTLIAATSRKEVVEKVEVKKTKLTPITATSQASFSASIFIAWSVP